ncbi:MAG: Tryptophan synthase beta chain, partial [Myxococcaceae bacterium]|nr:Tryptophan synthase beta chain [Myxococcaceae bacterium]
MQIRFSGGQDEIPRNWYNVCADLPTRAEPYIDPASKRPLVAADLSNMFTQPLIEQELDQITRYVPIPEDVREKYATWRPTPLIRAVALERYLDTDCKIFYKYEG